MKTLYVSDLDGTLLNRQDRFSDYTIETLNRLVERGLPFSYATARSLSSACVVAKGLLTRLPVIVYNGAFIRDATTGRTITGVRFSASETDDVVRFLRHHRLDPFVYAFVDGRERVSWVKGTENEGGRRYLGLRRGDQRLRGVTEAGELYMGDIFYFTCIGEKASLLSVYDAFKDDGRFRCTLQQELYRPEYWCEIMPRQATKANAILKLKELAQCEKIVTFGDAINDIPMFAVSDECYAVDNAVEELKRIATAVIPSNEDDGVARWLSSAIAPLS